MIMILPNKITGWIALFAAIPLISAIAFLSQGLGVSVDSVNPTLHQRESNNLDVTQAKPGNPKPPVIAYFLTGSRGDGERLKRLLLAIYHPGNEYLLHLSLDAPLLERRELSRFVRSHPIFMQIGNVDIIDRSNKQTDTGASVVTTTLHGMAVLLRRPRYWHWFINLCASDYPLITQDDFLKVMSSVPRNLSFVQHCHDLNKPVDETTDETVVDPAFYTSKDLPLVRTSETRRKPTAFELFTGSPFMVCTRNFAQYVILGFDNLPRMVLAYLINSRAASHLYFQTVIANSLKHRDWTLSLSLNLHLEKSEGTDARNMSSYYFRNTEMPMMIDNSTQKIRYVTSQGNMMLPFASSFAADDPVLDTIDKELLRGRRPGKFVVGGWCAPLTRRTSPKMMEVVAGAAPAYPPLAAGTGDGETDDPCPFVGDPNALDTGTGATAFGEFMQMALSNTSFWNSLCPK